jgi:hypothetical protein
MRKFEGGCKGTRARSIQEEKVEKAKRKGY